MTLGNILNKTTINICMQVFGGRDENSGKSEGANAKALMWMEAWHACVQEDLAWSSLCICNQPPRCLLFPVPPILIVIRKDNGKGKTFISFKSKIITISTQVCNITAIFLLICS